MPVRDLTGSTSPAPEHGRLESAGPAVEITSSDHALVITESDGTTLVEIRSPAEPSTLLISEPVMVDPRAAGLGIADLADVDAADAPVNVPLVWTLGSDGIWRTSDIDAARWGDEIRFAAAEPAVSEAPVGATWVDYQTGTIYRAEEA